MQDIEVFVMQAKLARPDLLLLISLLLAILLTPVLDHGDWRRLTLGGCYVHTSRHIHFAGVRDKRVGVADGAVGVGQCDLYGGE